MENHYGCLNVEDYGSLNVEDDGLIRIKSDFLAKYCYLFFGLIYCFLVSKVVFVRRKGDIHLKALLCVIPEKFLIFTRLS